jgi:hypothetical protein
VLAEQGKHVVDVHAHVSRDKHTDGIHTVRAAVLLTVHTQGYGVYQDCPLYGVAAAVEHSRV